MIAQGMSNNEIAEKFVISRHTVKGHVSNILSKLQVSNRAEAAVFAVKNHIERHLPKDDESQ